MKRISIAMTVALLCAWLLLNSTISIAQIVLGLVLAFVLVLVSARLRPLRARLRRIDVAMKLVAHVFADVVMSNLAVARVVLFRHKEIRSGTVSIPLELQDPHGLGVLAIIITSTPGTVWQGLSENRRELTLHVLDLVDEAGWVQKIKQRYEAPLREIFE